MTQQEQADYVAALMQELSYYKAQGNEARAADVKAELSRFAQKAASPAKRAAKRPARKTKETR